MQQDDDEKNASFLRLVAKIQRRPGGAVISRDSPLKSTEDQHASCQTVLGHVLFSTARLSVVKVSQVCVVVLLLLYVSTLYYDVIFI